ncbi:MAG TPA: preprotein translocase subunit YajC [Pirellulales bacterium]
MTAGIFNSILLLAEDAAPGGGAAPPNGPAGLLPMLFPLVLIFGLFYFLIMRPERRKQSDHKSLLESLKKNDRVVTIGGIYGVVANVQREDDRVTLKVDEANNTKLDVTFSSIARVLVEEAETDAK